MTQEVDINVALSPTVETILNCVLIYAEIMRGFAKIIEILRLKIYLGDAM